MPKGSERASQRILGAVCASLLLSGIACAPKTLTKAEFIQKGDKLCSQFQQRSRDVQPKTDPFQPGAAPADLQVAPRFLDYFATNLPQLAGDLRGLSPPPEERPLLNQTLSRLDGSGRQFARAKRAFEAGDPAAAKATLDRAFGSLEQAARSAQQYGFKQCGALATAAPAPPAPPGPEIAVAATEYVFHMPPEVPPGPHTFVIRNDGQERHFLTLVRLRQGIDVQRVIDSEKVGESTDELVEQSLGNSATALPGQTVRFNADMPPGNYGYACFIAAPDGQLHAYKGMAGRLTVK